MLEALKNFLSRLFGRSAHAPTDKKEEDRVPRHRSAKEPIARPRVNLDGEENLRVILMDEEENLFVEIQRRIKAGQFELPQLRQTSMAVMALANDPSADIQEITNLIQADPVLSSQLVKTANSALYSGLEPITSLHDGVMRLGLRALRTMILTASMKGLVLSGKGLTRYAEEVWAQAASVASIARAISPFTEFDKEKAFLLALLHDVGKFPLLAMLAEQSKRYKGGVTRALIGKAFAGFHEPVGRALAEHWKLGDELVSVAGNHHDFASNEDFGNSAALVSLAHKLDLYLSLRDEAGFLELTESPEVEFLGISPARRMDLLEAAKRAYSRRSKFKAAA